jgi:hypothetical protein
MRYVPFIRADYHAAGEADIPRFATDAHGIATIPIVKSGPLLLAIDRRVAPWATRSGRLRTCMTRHYSSCVATLEALENENAIPQLPISRNDFLRYRKFSLRILIRAFGNWRIRLFV